MRLPDFSEKVLHVRRLLEPHRLVALIQSLRMRRAALDLGIFPTTYVIGKKSAFRFDDEIEPLGSILDNQHGPVGVIGAERSRNLEPARQLGVNLDRLVQL